MLGILLIDKPLGCSSHDVVNTIRRKLGTKRVGHAGTLDPLGTGLLVVAVGPATRFLQYLPLEPKEYEGTILFGKRTSTYDAEGEVIAEAPVPGDLEDQLAALKPRFLGLIEQIPPMHSAVKVAGKPLYKYARQGEEVDRQTRTIHISSLEFGPFDGASVDFRLVCSGGTYVRTLADDLGQAVGCGAYLTRLRRTRVGRFSLNGAFGLDDVHKDKLQPLRQALAPMPVVDLDERQTESIREGRQVTIGDIGESPSKAEDPKIKTHGSDQRPPLKAPSDLNAQRSTLSAHESDLNARRSTLNASPSDLNAQRSTLNASPSNLNAQRSTLNASEGTQRSTLNASLVALAGPDGQVFSVARLLGNLVQPECVIPSEALDGTL